MKLRVNLIKFDILKKIKGLNPMRNVKSLFSNAKQAFFTKSFKRNIITLLTCVVFFPMLISGSSSVLFLSDSIKSGYTENLRKSAVDVSNIIDEKYNTYDDTSEVDWMANVLQGKSGFVESYFLGSSKYIYHTWKSAATLQNISSLQSIYRIKNAPSFKKWSIFI